MLTTILKNFLSFPVNLKALITNSANIKAYNKVYFTDLYIYIK